MTAQVHERLIYNGEETSMAFCPPIPKGHPRITENEIEKSRDSIIIGSTACWRGYIGTWEIKNGYFYLVKIEGGYRIIGDDPIIADWFTGALRIPKGEIIHYVHMGFGSVYEEEIHVKIENGKVVKSKVIDNRNKKIAHWELGWLNLPGGENRFDGDKEL